MADKDLAAITNAMAQQYAPVVHRTVNVNAPLLSLIRSEWGGGKNVAWDAEFDGEAAEAYTDGADVSTYTTDTVKPAVLQWGLYRANGKITDLAMDVAGTSAGPEELINLMGHELVNKARALALKLGTDMYVTVANGITGLNDALRDDNTYAGIDRTSGSNAKFRAKLIDPGALTPISLSLLRQDMNAIYDECGERPNIAMCSTAVWESIAALFDQSRQIQVSSMAPSDVVLNGGAKVIEIDGCRFVQDRLATANRIYYLNTNYVVIKKMRRVQRQMDDVAAEQALLGQTNQPLPIGMVVRPLARTGAAQKFTCSTTLQLCVEKPSACGMRLNVST